MSDYLTRQVEKIIDEGEGNLRSVIVQMQGEDHSELLETALQAAKTRSMVASSRDVLPPAIEAFREPSRASLRTRRRKLRDRNQV